MNSENHDDVDTTFEDDIAANLPDFDRNEYSFLSPSLRLDYTNIGRRSRRLQSGRYISMAEREETLKRAASQGRTAGRNDSNHHKIGLRVVASCEIHVDMTTDEWLTKHFAKAQKQGVIADYKVLDEVHGAYGLRFLLFSYKAVVPAGSLDDITRYVAAMTNDITQGSVSKVLAVEA